jgi:hypothetical protein
MGRRATWLERIDGIIHTVESSARSHYDRKDLTALFQLQRRAMFNLLQAMPTIQAGVLIDRTALLAFLERVRSADKPSAALVEARRERPARDRHKLRTYCRTEVASVVDELPAAITLGRGELRIKFGTLEELAYSLTGLAEVLDNDLDRFTSLYEPLKHQSEEVEARLAAESAEAEYYRNWGKSV